MKKKMVLRLLSLAMVASMTGTMLPSNLQLVSAEESVATEEKTEKAEETAVLEDGINDAWTLENEAGEDAVCAVENGWLNLKSGAQNDNTPNSGKQLMVVNPNKFDFTKAGYFSFTMKIQVRIIVTDLVYILDIILQRTVCLSDMITKDGSGRNIKMVMELILQAEEQLRQKTMRK